MCLTTAYIQKWVLQAIHLPEFDDPERRRLVEDMNTPEDFIQAWRRWQVGGVGRTQQECFKCQVPWLWGAAVLSEAVLGGGLLVVLGLSELLGCLKPLWGNQAPSAHWIVGAATRHLLHGTQEV